MRETDKINITDKSIRDIIDEARDIADMCIFKKARHEMVDHAILIHNAGLPTYDFKEFMKMYINCVEHELTSLGLRRHTLDDLKIMVDKL